ncbi:MAG: DUF4393 domain-containing protein [Verrucomicrobiota bacterium]
MSEDTPEKNTGVVTDAAKAIAAITENVPVYEDAVQPAAKELGKGLEIVAKAVTTALAPVEGMIWGVDQVKNFVRSKVAQKLESTPTEDIQPPKPSIGVPTVDALRYTGEEIDLAEMYANLLANSMDRATAYEAHPGFVDIIKNMSSDEAKVMSFLSRNLYYPLINIKAVNQENRSFRIIHRYVSLLGIDAGCDHPTLASNYIDNLSRLGIVNVSTTTKMHENKNYSRIKENKQIKSFIDSINQVEKQNVNFDEMRLEVTDLGRQFISVCIIDKRIKKRS